MTNNGLRALLILLVFSESLALAKGEPASAAPADKIYSVCEIHVNDTLGSDAPNNIADKEITIRAKLGRSYHFGVILTDDRCENNFVRIIFPVPDPKDVYRNFRLLYTPNQAAVSDSEYFTCDCSGHISFKYNIPELYIDDSVVNKLRAPEKLPTK